MVEPLLHFAVPLVSLKALGLDWKSALFASFVALTPDLDVLFYVHRSASHSVIVLLAIVIPILILARKNKTIWTLTLLAAFGVSTHLVLDLFQADTPLLWPLYDRLFRIELGLNFHMGSQGTFIPSVTVPISPEGFASFTTFDAPIITPEGLGITLVLLTPVLIQSLIKSRSAKRARRPRVRRKPSGRTVKSL